MALNIDKNKEVSQIHKLYCNLGSIYGRRGVFDSALHYLRQSIDLNPGFKDAHLNLGLTYFAMGAYQKSIDAYKHLLTLAPEEYTVNSDIGVAYQNLGQFEESVKWFDKAISASPGNGIFFLNRSYSYNALGNLPRAKSDALKAKENGTAIPPSYAQMLGI